MIMLGGLRVVNSFRNSPLTIESSYPGAGKPDPSPLNLNGDESVAYNPRTRPSLQ